MHCLLLKDFGSSVVSVWSVDRPEMTWQFTILRNLAIHPEET
jgi:hypothetical protein